MRIYSHVAALAMRAKTIYFAIAGSRYNPAITAGLKVHKNENFFGFDFEFCTISMLVMHK